MFKGSFVALVTPMAPGGDLDLTALERLVDFHLDAGTDGIVIGGTTGESPTLTADELEKMVRVVVSQVQGRIPVIAGSGTNSTAKTVSLSALVASAGADACLVVTPYYNKPTQHGLQNHYRTVADAISVPVILYNVPGRTACDMRADTVAKLSHHPNICGVKEATADIDRVDLISQSAANGFDLLSGDDATAREFILAGGHGVISVTANVAPHLMHEMCATALTGDRDAAGKIDVKLSDLHRTLFLESNPIPVKWALEKMQLIQSGIRSPLTRLDPGCHDQVRMAMSAVGVGTE